MMWRSIFRKYIHNKYFYTGAAFVIWLTFFDQESLIDQYRLSRTIDELEDQKTFYLEEIDRNERTLYELENDSARLEQLAREKYFMKRDNEEVFVIIKDDNEK
jgi:cell division protein FtsB